MANVCIEHRPNFDTEGYGPAVIWSSIDSEYKNAILSEYILLIK